MVSQIEQLKQPMQNDYLLLVGCFQFLMEREPHSMHLASSCIGDEQLNPDAKTVRSRVSMN
jgi:hypothetical protein